MTFEIHDRAFWFDPIDLVGDALTLRGRGSVGFGGDVVLDFFSRPAKGILSFACDSMGQLKGQAPSTNLKPMCA
ncbi:MAG: hypothetical protein U0936_19995 [Planctomycetaceae bacterium]